MSEAITVGPEVHGFDDGEGIRGPGILYMVVCALIMVCLVVALAVLAVHAAKTAKGAVIERAPIAEAAEAGTTSPGPRTVVADTRRRIIEPGDTLLAIAIEEGVSMADICAINPKIVNPHLIYAGDTIEIPVYRD